MTGKSILRNKYDITNKSNNSFVKISDNEGIKCGIHKYQGNPFHNLPVDLKMIL